MSKKRRSRKSIASMVLVWIGRRMLRRVQQQSLQQLTGTRSRVRAGAKHALDAAAPRARALPAALNSPAQRKRAGKGLAVALLSTVAVAALKVGVDHVLESEREQQVVTPDFDVFSEDED